MNKNNLREIYGLLDKLCRILAGKKYKETFENVTKFIAELPILCSNLPYDENSTVSKLIMHLPSNSQNEVLLLNLHEELSTYTELHNRNSILIFLLYVSDYKKSQKSCNIKSGNQLHMSSNSVELFPLKNKLLEGNSKFKVVPIFDRPTKMCNSLNIPTVKNDLELQGMESPDLIEELVQEAIYSFTGIQGKYLRKDIITGGFRLDPNARKLNSVHAGMLIRLSELGYYHNQIQTFTSKKSGRNPLGLLGQGLISCLQKELTQYYGMVAMLQEQLNKEKHSNFNISKVNQEDKLTLLKVMLWAADPIHRLKWLTTIADACQDKKGGALASAVYNFKKKGDPSVKTIVKELLVAICNPLQCMLSKWILDGEIEDPFSEFFIETLPEVCSDRLWHDKYRVREGLLPNFISKQLAHKILVTGKSINYLREVCLDKTPIRGRDDLKQCFVSNVNDLFSSVSDTKLHLMIDNVYLNTSKKVLDIVMGPHKLLEHLQAMRRYLLLGQGDFIGLLMENLKPQLDRSAKDLYRHDLSSIVDVTVRATNAQFDDPEVLNHLNVRLMDSFEGDTGWDIFTLRYLVRGPLSTMLEPSMCTYNILFKPLWRTKHIEFVLSSKIWKDQKYNAKYLRGMRKELNSITYHLYLYTSEMIHFIHQMQYYILFEVVECSWANLLKQIQQANALDDILEAHQDFLKAVKIGIFLDEKSATLTGNLERVYRSIMKLETWQNNFNQICYKEYDSRKKFDDHIKTSAFKSQYGLTAESVLERDEASKAFEHTVLSCHKNLDKIGTDFEFAVRQFLLMLASTNDNKLQLFGIRLDFNEYYKKRDQRLGQPLTFEHMRMSAMYSNNKSLIMNCNK